MAPTLSHLKTLVPDPLRSEPLHAKGNFTNQSLFSLP
eukprot:COSAG01_NODE_75190_length_198_cov_19.494949_1_plen_36_part_10